MAELKIDAKTAAWFALLALWGLLGWICLREIGRIDVLVIDGRATDNVIDDLAGNLAECECKED